MARYCVDCREYPSEKNCDMIMCGGEEHLIDAAVTHAVTAHGHEDTPKRREWTRQSMKPESAATRAA